MGYILHKAKYLKGEIKLKNYVAIGDLVLDVYLDNKLMPLGYHSGGSVWNDLINIKEQNQTAQCFGIGTCGGDWIGDHLLDIFAHRNIDMSNIKRTKHQTNRFSVVVNHDKTKSHKTCPACSQKIWYSETSYPRTIPEIFLEIDPGVVIIDCLKKSVLDLAKEFKDHGWYISADIGYINHLRYMSTAKIRNLLIGRFDILQINERVYSFLANKLSVSSKAHLFELLGCRYLSVTNGEEGSVFLFEDEKQKIVYKTVPAKTVDPVDPTGAGDMYFSTLLSSLNRMGVLVGDIDVILEHAAVNAADRVRQLGGVGVLEQIELHDGDCPICGYVDKTTGISKNKHKRKQIETNTTCLYDRILHSLDSCASSQVKSVLDSIEGIICMIGTGGSFTAAYYAAEVINQCHNTSKAIAYHPRDALIDGLNKVNAVFLFSYSGNTKDILTVYSMCIRNSIPVYLVTKKHYSSLPELNGATIISYSNSTSDAKERGFLSMAGTLIPMCIFTEAFFAQSYSPFHKFLEERFIAQNEEYATGIGIAVPATSRFTVDVFYEKSSICAALDLESKFIESGVGRVVLHEKKDFSHGRFNILERMPPDFIVYLEGQQGQYSKKLKEYLNRRSIPTVFIKTQFSGVLGQLDLMIAIQFFLNALSKQIDYDMSKPGYPEDAMLLYRYSGKDLF